MESESPRPVPAAKTQSEPDHVPAAQEYRDAFVHSLAVLQNIETIHDSTAVKMSHTCLPEGHERACAYRSDDIGITDAVSTNQFCNFGGPNRRYRQPGGKC